MSKASRQKIIDNLLESGKKCQMCLNCKYSYITEETGFGFCYYDGFERPPTLLVKPIHETHWCPHWNRKTTKKKQL